MRVALILVIAAVGAVGVTAAPASLSSSSGAHEHDHNARAAKMLAELESGDSPTLDAMERSVDERLASTKHELDQITSFRKRAMGLLQIKLAELAAGGNAADQSEANTVRQALEAGERLDKQNAAEAEAHAMRLAQLKQKKAAVGGGSAATASSGAEAEADVDLDLDDELDSNADADVTVDENSLAADLGLDDLTALEEALDHEGDADMADAETADSDNSSANSDSSDSDSDSDEEESDGDSDSTSDSASQHPIDALIALDTQEVSTRAALARASDQFAHMRLAEGAPRDATSEAAADAALDHSVSVLKAKLALLHTQRAVLFHRSRLHPQSLLRVDAHARDRNGKALTRDARVVLLAADRDRLRRQLISAESVYGAAGTDTAKVDAKAGDPEAAAEYSAKESLLSWIALIDAELADTQQQQKQQKQQK